MHADVHFHICGNKSAVTFSFGCLHWMLSSCFNCYGLTLSRHAIIGIGHNSNIVVLDFLGLAFKHLSMKPSWHKASARQQYLYESPYRRNPRQINAISIMLKSTSSGLQRCHFTGLSFRLAVNAFEINKIPKNSPKIRTNSSSCVIDFGANRKRKRICMQLPISH